MTLLFAHSIHTFDAHKQIPAKGSCKNLSKFFIFGYVSMQHLSFKDTPDLFINHFIVLGNKNNIKTKMAVHSEKFYPLQTVFLVPAPGIKYCLALVQNNKCLVLIYLTFFVTSMKLQSKILKTINIRKCFITNTLATNGRLQEY